MKSKHRFRTRADKGFTLLEMSMVLIAIALIIGATTIGTNLQRNATYQNLATDFVRGWQLSYLSYFNTIGVVPGDSTTTPTGKVNAGSTTLCSSNGSTGLRDVMYAAGVKMPIGRAEGFEDHYGYLDSNGNPQDTDVCFQNVDWSVPSGVGTYVTQKKNVMIISRLTPDLARMLDSMIDGVTDARFGDFRESTNASATTTTSLEWSIDNRRDLNTGTDSNLDEAQVGLVTAYYLMNP
jgi:prepilin-type N-terminal cleavage/methylation domain-containing protein